MIWDNRNFKSFRPEVRDYFKYQRHERHTVYLFSQTFDVDVKLRNLTDCMYLCTCHMGWLSVARRINRNIVVVQAQGDSESRIADNLEFAPLWTILFGGKPLIFTFIPRRASMFDSHEKLGLEQIKNFDIQEIPLSLQKQYKFLFNTRRRKHSLTPFYYIVLLLKLAHQRLNSFFQRLKRLCFKRKDE